MPEAERKVRQLDADVHEIYDLLERLDRNVGDVRARMMRQEARLNQIESDLQGLAEVQGAHTAALDSHTATLDSHTATLANHGAKLDQIIALLTGENDAAQ